MSTVATAPRFSNIALNYPPSLPITALKDEIVSALREHQVIIVAGETGSGKSTQIPKMCLEAGLGRNGKIGCTQPRRIAALSVARRIAKELGVTWGGFVGSKIRFADRTNPQTVIKVMTDGVLLAETRSDPNLQGYDALVIDEAHERSLNIDLLLGLLRTIVAKRHHLKVIITSATIDTELFSKAFNDAPILRVSGRVFPVELRYRPIDHDAAEGEECTYIDGVVRGVKEVFAESIEGDVLVFLPSERDIRETRERLLKFHDQAAEVLPLMGALSTAEQERVFEETGRRKIIIATNIAETSLTIPNIRYVIDTGLARISRYNPRTRTKCLPIEPISQSSAKQRAGRAGRVRAGICIRLYSEDELSRRALFSTPEIQRANLAEIVLRMKAFYQGALDDFPFLEAPERRAFRSAYAALYELGALSHDHALTALGKKLAHLPLDPVIGRMLLQSQREHSIEEMLVIAAALSIQDPRERPLEKKEQAQQAHRTFRHPDSDFLTLLNLWNAFQSEWESSESQNKLRKWCKARYLSYPRMREWAELHDELRSVVREDWRLSVTEQQSRITAPSSEIKRFDGRYRSIHRAILAGLIGQTGMRVQRNTYRISGGRHVTLFPGSVLRERFQRRKDEKRRHAPRGHQAAWIVAGEILQTSNLFARLVAPIIPSWIEDVGTHLCKRSVRDVHWDVRQGAVLAHEEVTIFGMMLAKRRTDFARFDAYAARELFIRGALLTYDQRLTHPGISHNRDLIETIESRLSRERRFDRAAIEEALISFYTARLPVISSVAHFQRWSKEALRKNPSQLSARVEDLIGNTPLPEASTAFPEVLTLDGVAVPLLYRYEPGAESDGVTVRLPLQLARAIPAELLEGAIPGLRQSQIHYMLVALPKEYRRQLPPLIEVSQALAKSLAHLQKPLVLSIAERLASDFRVSVPLPLLNPDNIPRHLRPQIEIVNGEQVVARSRNLCTLQEQLAQPKDTTLLEGWSNARTQWEQSGLRALPRHNLPEQIEITTIAGVPLHAYPALVPEASGSIAIRLFEKREEAVSSNHRGIARLLTLHLASELKELYRATKEINNYKPLFSFFNSSAALREGLLNMAKQHLLDGSAHYPLRKETLDQALVVARARSVGLWPDLLNGFRRALEMRRQIVTTKRQYRGMREDLEKLMPPDFLQWMPYFALCNLSRYLRAMVIRGERAALHPNGDAQKLAVITPYCALLSKHEESFLPANFRWMIEELKVSVFAPELGTAYPISPQRLDRELQLAKR